MKHLILICLLIIPPVHAAFAQSSTLADTFPPLYASVYTQFEKACAEEEAPSLQASLFPESHTTTRFAKTTAVSAPFEISPKFLPMPFEVSLAPQLLTDVDAPQFQSLLLSLFQRGLPLTGVRHAEKRAQSGEPWAQYLLGLSFEEGVLLPPNRQEAARWYQRAAQQNHSHALYRLARLLLAQETLSSEMHTQALRLLAVAARAKDQKATFSLLCQKFSRFLKLPDKDQTAAQQEQYALLLQLAKDNHTLAQYSMARLYLAREQAESKDPFFGIAPDPHLGAYWMGRAARNGHTPAQVEYGFLRIRGEGVIVNKEEGYGWIKRAAYAGSPFAMSRMARLYTRADALGYAPEKAAWWYRRAKEFGFEDAFMQTFFDNLPVQHRTLVFEKAHP